MLKNAYGLENYQTWKMPRRNPYETKKTQLSKIQKIQQKGNFEKNADIAHIQSEVENQVEEESQVKNPVPLAISTVSENKPKRYQNTLIFQKKSILLRDTYLQQKT